MDKPLKSNMQSSFRRAVLRGLAILMPPLLTIVLFIWAWSVIERYILVPTENIIASAVSWSTADVLNEIPGDAKATVEHGETVSFLWERRVYEPDDRGRWVGYYPLDYVMKNQLKRTRVLPFFIAVFLMVLYLLGKFVAAGVGRMIVGSFDSFIHRIPIISNVYSAVKQVTDFIFSERDIEFNRVVAVEYPRKGIWSIGFVTGESMLDIRSAAQESVLSVLVPTSPMPMTGFTVTVLKSEAIDLNLTLDQAIQFIVSCGVVVPRHQQIPISAGVDAIIADAVAKRRENGRAASGLDNETLQKIEAPRD
jgi:uncharacterized membrane protein